MTIHGDVGLERDERKIPTHASHSYLRIATTADRKSHDTLSRIEPFQGLIQGITPAKKSREHTTEKGGRAIRQRKVITDVSTH